MFTQTQNSRNIMKNVVTTFGKTFNAIYSIEDSHPKRSSDIFKQGEIKQVIKKDDKDADTEATEKDLKSCILIFLAVTQISPCINIFMQPVKD
jgi:hypothetical protein